MEDIGAMEEKGRICCRCAGTRVGKEAKGPI